MATSVVSATPTGPPGPDGRCGWQNGNVTCLPMQGRTCCSINGFCGNNETYCLESNGCQYGCAAPCEFDDPPCAPKPSIPSNSSTTASSTATTTTTTGIIRTPSASASATSTPVPGLAAAAKAGIAVGALVFVAILIAGLAYCLRRRRRPHSTIPPPEAPAFQSKPMLSVNPFKPAEDVEDVPEQRFRRQQTNGGW